ncbi:MAG TPA: HAD family hydrolase [Xanthobacteraceae bacterium]|nr:HAD family hydrolase [Xanthobacteraceae bacterium]
MAVSFIHVKTSPAPQSSEVFAIDIAIGLLLKATRQRLPRGEAMIRLVLFDFDGTLVDSNALKQACMRATVADLPGGLAALARARRLGGNRYTLFAEVARLLDSSGEPGAIARRGRALAAAYTRCCARAIAAAPERRGARAALAALKARGIRIWLNSATPHRDLLAIVRGRGLLPWLDGVLGGPASKTANLRAALAAERLAPRQALMVGDGPDDLEAARALGTLFVAITAENRLAGKGRFAMRDLARLPALIDRIRSRPVRG